MDDQLQMALSPQQPLGGQRVRRITGLWKRKHKKTTGQTYKERLKDNILKFGAINVATLRGKEEEMVELMKLRQLSVLGLSETRMKGCGDRIIHGGYRLIYSGEDSGRHGVALLVSSDIAQCVEKVIFKNDRIISIDFKLRTAISIIQVYAPQQGRPLKEKEEFYELLQTTMSEVMYQDSMILCGDWNGHIGCDRKQYETVLGIHSIGNRNEEGKRILDFAVVNNLCILNTFYQHRESQKWTWYRWNNQRQEYTDKSMIDLFLTNQKSIINDVKAVPSVSLDADHRLVIAKLKIKVAVKKAGSSQKRFNLVKLKERDTKDALVKKLEDNFQDNVEEMGHWNLNSICARSAIKIPLIEAYNSVHYFDIITISESMLDQSISDDSIFIEGFSREIYRSDHPSNSKTGGVCVYFREGLPIKRRSDLELLQELIVTELTLSRKKIFLITLYRSPSQTSEQYENVIDRLQVMINRVRGERPYCLIITGDFTCRSSQWWEHDAENLEGSVLDELIETNDLYQLINEPTNIRDESRTCIDLIITDQPNFFVESGTHPSLDDHCQHQIIYGKLNLSTPAPPPYRRTIWDYPKADTNKIRNALNSIDWRSLFSGLGSNGMVDIFTDTLFSVISSNIPNKVINCNDKDPPWITPELKTAIKRKHRVYRKYVKRGQRKEDWNQVKDIRNKTSKMIIRAKEKYFLNLGRKLSDPNQGIKAYWKTLNRLLIRKR